MHMIHFVMQYIKVSCFYEPGDLMAFFADPGWIISHCFAVHGALSSGSTSFLYDGSLRDKNIGKYQFTVVQDCKFTVYLADYYLERAHGFI